MIFQGTGRTQTYVDQWTDKHAARKKTRSKWTGKTVFFKKSAKAVADSATVPRDGVHIQPGTTEHLRTGLAAMRTELAAAQRKDPRLLEIINGLRGATPKSQYIVDPRGAAGKRAGERALHYRLAVDNVLVAKGKPDDHWVI